MQTLEELKNRVVVLSRKELEKTELDSENDLRDLLSKKLGLKNEKFEEVMSGWDVDDKYYVVVVKS